MFCDGRLLQIAGHYSLYSILGTTYGGNGTTTFAIPDLRGRTPVHPGNGISPGEYAGEEAHTLTMIEMPEHTHRVLASDAETNTPQAAGHVWGDNGGNPYTSSEDGSMRFDAVAAAGEGSAHLNMQPYLTSNYCIAVDGVFPSKA